MVGLHGPSDWTSPTSEVRTRAAASLRRLFAHQTPKATSTRRPTAPPAAPPMMGAMRRLRPPLAPRAATLCVADTMVVV